jgi:hypothetical protein
MMSKILRFLFIIEEKKVIDNGDEDFFHRFNPYNPLSYLTILVFIILSLPLFGVVGTFGLVNTFKNLGITNPFKWF